MKVSIVVAMAKNNVIGSKDRIPWLLRADLVKLKNLTLDNIVILGRKSYDSMVWYYNKSGREMPGSLYIVITTNREYKPEKDKAAIAYSVEEALDKAEELGSAETFVIGGAAIFELMLPLADKLYTTEVDAVIEGDSVFPSIDQTKWKETSREHHLHDEKNQYGYDFVTLEKRQA